MSKIYKEDEINFTRKFKHKLGFIMGVKYIGFDASGKCYKVKKSWVVPAAYTIDKCEDLVKGGYWEEIQ